MMILLPIQRIETFDFDMVAFFALGKFFHIPLFQSIAVALALWNVVY